MVMKKQNLSKAIFLVMIISFLVFSVLCACKNYQKNEITTAEQRTEKITSAEPSSNSSASNKTKSSYSSSSGSSAKSSYSSESHECYVCGKTATKKVGSYWYCSSCAAIVSAVSGETASDKKNSYSSGYGSSSYGSKSSSYGSKKGAGGYDMPNENDKSFSDYVKRVDPDLYKSMEDIYNSLY